MQTHRMEIGIQLEGFRGFSALYREVMFYFFHIFRNSPVVKEAFIIAVSGPSTTSGESFKRWEFILSKPVDFPEFGKCSCFNVMSTDIS